VEGSAVDVATHVVCTEPVFGGRCLESVSRLIPRIELRYGDAVRMIRNSKTAVLATTVDDASKLL
jgi:hypothetical protein